MGKQPAPDEHLSRAEQAARLPSFMATGAPTSQNEQWARMTNDPLLAIKQQEQEALKRVKHNPVKMQQILKEVSREGGLHADHIHAVHQAECVCSTCRSKVCGTVHEARQRRCCSLVWTLLC